MDALVFFGTRYGSTTGVAEEIGKTLEGRGSHVTITDDLKDIGTVDNFGLVIIGSGIQAGKWTDGVKTFLGLFASELSRNNAAFFVSCGEAMKPEKHEWIRKQYINRYLRDYPEIAPLQLGIFGGVFDFEGRHKGIDNPFLVKVRKDLEDRGFDTRKMLDFRNLPYVREWTLDLIEKIETS